MTEIDWLAADTSADFIDTVLEKYEPSPAGDRKLRLFSLAMVYESTVHLQLPKEYLRVYDRVENMADALTDEVFNYEAGQMTYEFYEAPDLPVSGTYRYLSAGARLFTRNAARGAYDTEAAIDAELDRQSHNRRGPVRHFAFGDVYREIWGNPFQPATFDATWRTPDVVELADAAYRERNDRQLDHQRLKILADALEEAGCPLTYEMPVPLRVRLSGKDKKWTVSSQNPYFDGWTDRFQDSRRALALDWAQQKLKVKTWTTSMNKRHWYGEGQEKIQITHPILNHLRSDKPHYRGCWALDLVLGK